MRFDLHNLVNKLMTIIKDEMIRSRFVMPCL